MTRVASTALLTALALLGLVTACTAPTTTPPIEEVGAKVYVTDEDSGDVKVIDARTRNVIATIALSESDEMLMPHNVQVAPNGESVWVTALPMEGMGNAMEQVVVIDPKTDAIVARILLGEELHLAHVVLDGTSSTAYVTANEADEVIVIDVASRTVKDTIALPAGAKPHGMRVCGDQGFIAEMGGGGMAVLDLDSGALTELALGGVGVQTACTGMYAFVSLYDTKEVVRYDIMDGTTTRIALPVDAQGPVQLYPSPDGETIYVCDQGMLLDRPASNKLYSIDVDAAEVSGVATVGQGAHGVVVDETGAFAYVTNQAEDTVSVVDLASMTEIDRVDVGTKPNGIGHWHVTGGMP